MRSSMGRCAWQAERGHRESMGAARPGRRENCLATLDQWHEPCCASCSATTFRTSERQPDNRENRDRMRSTLNRKHPGRGKGGAKALYPGERRPARLKEVGQVLRERVG